MLRVCSLAGEERVAFDDREFNIQTVRVLKTLAAKQIGVSRFRQRWLCRDHTELSDDTIMMTAGDVQLIVLDFVQAEDGEFQKLFEHCKSNNVDQVDELLRKPLDPNVMFVDRMCVDEGGHEFRGMTALHVAALSNSVECVALLLDAGADKDARDLVFGVTVWHVAVARNHLEVMGLLLEAGEDPDAVLSGRTALHFTAQQGIPEMVRLLLESHANVDAVDADGMTALDLAIERSHRWDEEPQQAAKYQEVVRLLQKRSLRLSCYVSS